MSAANPLIDGRFRVVGKLGDPLAPFADEVADDIGNHYSLTFLDASYGRAAADEVGRRLEAFDHHSALRLINHGRDASGASFVLGEVPNAEALSVRLRRQKALTIGEARTVGERLFDVLGAMHPTAGHLAPSDGIVHNHVRPSAVLWDARDDRVVLADFARSSLPGTAPQQETLPIGSSDPYQPPDAGRLGHHPSVDLYAACTLLLEALTLGHSTEAIESAQLVSFMEKGRAPEDRHRYQDAEQARAAWLEAASRARVTSVPQEWRDLEEEIFATALRFRVEIDRADPVGTARALTKVGLTLASVRDIETLNEIKFDIQGELGQFQKFAARIIADLNRLAGETTP